ncbi:MAG: murein transglycosylase domain-containing protein [Candidatus Cloacimonetes bacterium]|nr:murein transglycosylase domain-containing protein [Candidatus Cloacimonadota bacterium]
MKRIILFFLTSFVLSISLSAQGNYEDYLKQQDEQFSEYKENEIQAFKKYFAQQDSMFVQFKKQIEKEWNEFMLSTPKEWVTYSPDFKGRSQVDFENGAVIVEAVIEKNIEGSEKKAQELALKHIKTIVQEPDRITNKPILAEQVEIPKSKEKLTPANIEKAAQNIVENGKSETITGADGKERIKFTITLNMAPDHLKKRIADYKPEIEKLCHKNRIDPALALAIIHTESYFNPKAYNSHGNAYGMMQIVPKYAGLTMNSVLYKSNSQPTAEQLYNPEINMAMGIGYLRWLADNKWDRVTNKTNQYYAIICSYNGGPGTIYKAMTGTMKNIGDKKWNKMFEDLNKMDSNKLFKKLHKDVPWEETRNYIKLVTEKMDKYYKE